MASNPYTGNYVNYNAQAAGVTPASNETPGNLTPEQQAQVLDALKRGVPTQDGYISINEAFNNARLGLDKIRLMTFTGQASSKDVLDVMQVPGHADPVTGLMSDAGRYDSYGRMVPNVQPQAWQMSTLVGPSGKPTVEANLLIANPKFVTYFETFYPGMIDKLFADQPEKLDAYHKLAADNQAQIKDMQGKWAPARDIPGETTYKASNSAAAGTQKAATTDSRVELPPNQTPGALNKDQRRNITKKAQSLSPNQLQKKIDSIATTGGNQRRLQQMQNVAVNRAIGPMSAKNKALFSKVRQRRALGQPISAKTQKKLTNIKQNRATRYTNRTGNTYYKTGYKPPKPTLGAAPNFNNIAGLGAAFSQAVAQGNASTAAGQNNNFNNMAPIIAALTKKG